MAVVIHFAVKEFELDPLTIVIYARHQGRQPAALYEGRLYSIQGPVDAGLLHQKSESTLP